MKKISIVVFGFMLLLLLGIVVVDSVYNKDTDTTVKIGMLLNGEISDQSWSQSHYEGIEKTKEELGLEIVYRENVPENEQSIAMMEEMIEDGCEIIICNSYGYGTYELAVAKKHPEICFYHAAGEQTGSTKSVRTA